MRTSSVEQLILDLFASPAPGKSHFTAQEVYQELKPRLPAVSPSTVYRALERMTLAGKVSVSDMGLGAAVYEEVGGKPHHHLVCQACRRVFTLEDELVHPFFAQVAGRFNFQVTTNHLVLFGYCAECRTESSSSAAGTSRAT
jgi:Fur family ferric uptake transcriptional regulator